MEKSIQAKQPKKSRNKFFLIFFTILFFVPVLSQAYADKIWIRSPKSIKTVYDVKVFAVLRNLYENYTLIDPEDEKWQRIALIDERDALLEQLVVYQYVKENRIDLSIPTYQVLNTKKKIALTFDDEKKRKAFFEQWGINERDIDQWIDKRLTLEKFLQTHAPFQANITDKKIELYYEETKDKKFLNQPLSQVRDVVEQDFKRYVLKTEFNKWMNQEMKRQKWTVDGI